MKITLQFLAVCLLVNSASAEFRTWTRDDGKTAELELTSTSGAAGDKAGVFKMRNGRSVTLKASSLSTADAKLLDEWTPPVDPAAAAANTSVFDEMLDGNLIKLSGKSLKSFKDMSKPTKYYLFYYTASWCGPCQQFTPSLVSFYDKNKPGNNEFEIILISSDSDEKSMEKYAVDKKMQWPHLKMSRTSRFTKKFKHPGSGIPNLVLSDLDGNLIKTSYVNGNYVGPTVVMDHLEGLLKK